MDDKNKYKLYNSLIRIDIDTCTKEVGSLCNHYGDGNEYVKKKEISFMTVRHFTFLTAITAQLQREISQRHVLMEDDFLCLFVR